MIKHRNQEFVEIQAPIIYKYISDGIEIYIVPSWNTNAVPSVQSLNVALYSSNMYYHQNALYSQAGAQINIGSVRPFDFKSQGKE